MNPSYEKTADGHDEVPKRTPGEDSHDRVQKSQKPPDVDDLVIKQIHDWQMDTEVQAFIHKEGKRGGKMGN